MPVLRSEQEEILQYTGGKMGISAVPGSGKTWTLSLLTADIIQRGVLDNNQEVLVVTLVNSAVDNFYRQVNEFIERKGLIPFLGYRVRTLHGLAHDIVRERPALVGLSETFTILDEGEINRILSEVTRTWVRTNPDTIEGYLSDAIDEPRLNQARRRDLVPLINEIAASFIRIAKDLRLSPQQIQAKLDHFSIPLPLAEMGCEIYKDYQQSLQYRSAVDFDDLVCLALQALESDAEYLHRLRHRWPYILEDEAQDSNHLQEQILELLSGTDGNWVRIGDPNQAIYETFTTANPRYLRDFIRREDVKDKTLSLSGRSTFSIIMLANMLVEWTQKEHETSDVRNALQAPPLIHPTSEDDPQPNPPDDPHQIHLITETYTPQKELQAVVESLAKWVPEHKSWTVAVLVPRNQRGFDLADRLRQRGIDFDDSLLRASVKTRSTARILANLVSYLEDPQSKRKLIQVYMDWCESRPGRCQEGQKYEETIEQLRRIELLEDYLAPAPGRDWLEIIDADGKNGANDNLKAFRRLIRRWHESVVLPVDQLLLTLGQDVFTEPNDLALIHKLAVLLRQANNFHPTWRLPDFSQEIHMIAQNKRKLIGFSEQDSGFDPEKYKGIVVISTMHKAKGLEWDRVYLMSVNNFNFPSGFEGDQYVAEKWFIRNNLNLQAETLSQLEAMINQKSTDWIDEGVSTQKARLDLVRERLRLLYVGITRAKRELVITSNDGRGGKLKPAYALIGIKHKWIDHLEEMAFEEPRSEL